MASVSRDAGGLKRILFTDGDRKRWAIRLGKMPVKTAESFRLRVEALLMAQTAGVPVAQDDARWLAELPDTMHDRLVKVGLAEPRAEAAKVTLGELLDQYEQTATVKASTLAAYRQAINSLRDYFGEAMPLDTLTPADADDWRKAIVDAGYATATVAKRVRMAKAIFAKAVRWGMIVSSPFADLKTGSQSNPDRAFYVAPETVEAVLAECPDDQWRGIIALCRYAGLRCPSELLPLRWGDVNWERGLLTVHSPKTEGHEGHAVRVVPVDPRLRTILQDLFDDAEPGPEWIIPRLRDPGVNLRTHFRRIILRAGYEPWPRLFQNLRASCETDWVELVPAHVAAGWVGHSVTIAAKHYLQTRDTHFDVVTGLGQSGAESGALVAQNAAQHRSAPTRAGLNKPPEVLVGTDVTRDNAVPCLPPYKHLMGAGGFEPPKAYASRFTVCPLWPLGYTPGPRWPTARSIVPGWVEM